MVVVIEVRRREENTGVVAKKKTGLAKQYVTVLLGLASSVAVVVVSELVGKTNLTGFLNSENISTRVLRTTEYYF